MPDPSDTSTVSAAAMASRIDRLSRDIQARVSAAVKDEADAVMARSKSSFVPVRTGALRDSGRVTEPTRHGDSVSVTLSYGDEATAPYAIAIHEHPSKASPPSWNGVQVVFSPEGTGPKYLERPLMDAVSGMDRRIADKVRI